MPVLYAAGVRAEIEASAPATMPGRRAGDDAPQRPVLVRPSTSVAHLRQAQAELAEAPGDARAPEHWEHVAASWRRLEHPYWAASAEYRQAATLLAGGRPRSEVEPILRRCATTARGLGASLLDRQVASLARRARIQPTAATRVLAPHPSRRRSD